jgi:hypothetical protein
MQVLIALSLFSFASFAFGHGEFNAKIQLHSQVLAKTREAVQKAGAAEAKFNELTKICKSENIKDQTSLLDCGSQFSSVSEELGKLKYFLESARAGVHSLPPDLAPSKEALTTTLDKSAALIDTSSEVARNLAKAFFAANGSLLVTRFNKAGRSQFIQSKTKYFCDDFQSNMDQQADVAQMSFDQNLSFGTLYVLSYRMQNTSVIAPTVAQVCKKEFNLSGITIAFKNLQPRLTNEAFFSFRREACKESTQISTADSMSLSCNSLPLTPYSVYWLIAKGARQ